jgi:hypothetical protein
MDKTQNLLIGLGSLVGVILLAVIVCVGSYISAYNYGNQMEKTLEASWQNSQNVLAQYGQKIQEMAQIPDMYAADTQKVVTAAIQARYGQEGSKALMQWIKEQNPSLDSSVYTKIEQAIEAGRDEFKNSQTVVIDNKRSYETALGSFWTGMWLRIAGYPKVDLNKYKLVTTDRAEKAFATGKEDGPIKLR